MDERATGIILRVRPLTESSLITHWLTPLQGRIATVAKGARRPKSVLRGKLDLYFSASFSFRRSKRSDLHNLREATLLDTRPDLRREIARLNQAAYAVRLIELATEAETPVPGVHALFEAFLHRLQTAPPSPVPVLAFELGILADLGLQPDPADTRLSPKAKSIVEKLQAIDWQGPGGRGLTADEFNEVSGFIKHFIANHLERIPKGRDEALEQVST